MAATSLMPTGPLHYISSMGSHPESPRICCQSADRQETRGRLVSEQTKFILDEKHLPKSWYNLNADLPKPLPPVLHPGTKQPVGPADLEPLFPMELILQEVTAERYIDIPEPIRDVFLMWRPSPLMRARRLE